MRTITSVLALLLCLCCYANRVQAQQYTYTSIWPIHTYQSVDDALHCWVAAYANQIGSSSPLCSKSANTALCAYGAGWFGTQYFSTTVTLQTSKWWFGYIDNTLLGRQWYLGWDSADQWRWNGYSWKMYSVQYFNPATGQGQGTCTFYQKADYSYGDYTHVYYYATYTGSAF